MQDMPLVQTTHGVVLDPFSIMVGGLTRRVLDTQKKIKDDGFWDNIHGEAKFKQAFINACHFADTMTVVGPVAQLNWPNWSNSLSSPPSLASPTSNAVWWGCPNHVGDNQLFFDEVRRFLKECNRLELLGNIDLTQNNNNCYLNLMPDTLLSWCTPTSHPGGDVLGQISKHLYDTRHFDTFKRGTLHPVHLDGFERGFPVVSLMAVIFSFKRPDLSLAVSELTNLGGWPPVCFLIPVLAPAGTRVTPGRPHWSGHDDIRSFISSTQPGVVSYQIRITPEKDYSRRTVPYGQPYRLRSVERWGKPSDVLRSLSDVFQALWSKATQYCAWNTQWRQPEIPNGDPYPEFVVGDLSLDPIGSGRRIRGHNRFSSKYDLHGMSYIWEDQAGGTPVMWGGKGRSLDPVTDLAVYNNMPGRNMMFVLPSFFDEYTVTNLAPVAVALSRYALVGNQVGHLSDFLTGKAVGNTYPRRLDENDSPEVTPKSFSDFMMDQQGVASQLGALPIQTIQSRVAFDADGTPEVFGLRFKTPNLLMTTRAGMTLGVAADIYNDMEELGDFQFMDAFCASSSKELSDTFDQVKAKKTKRSTSSGTTVLVDDDIVVDLFGGSSDDSML